MNKHSDVGFDKLHLDMPAEQYHGIDCASRSDLFPLTQGQTLAHVRESMNTPNVATPAMQIGTALHTYTLEPENFDNEIVEALDLPRRSNADKATHEQFAEQHAGKVILKPSDMQLVQSMGASINAHDAAHRLLTLDSVREASTLWTETKVNDLRCKARPDIIIESGLHTLVDVKTTQDASPQGFAKSISNFGYHFQAAWYLRGCNALNIDVTNFIFICVEKAPPHCVAVYSLAVEVIARAHELLADPVERMAQAYASNKWAGYSQHIEDIALPTWAMRDITLDEEI